MTATIALGAQRNTFRESVHGRGAGNECPGARTFYRTVTNVHRWLAVEGEHRATARAITGACNAAFLLLAVTGLSLWVAAAVERAQHVAAVTLVRSGLRGKARDFNWHNAIGFWCAPILIVLTASGMVMSTRGRAISSTR